MRYGVHEKLKCLTLKYETKRSSFQLIVGKVSLREVIHFLAEILKKYIGNFNTISGKSGIFLIQIDIIFIGSKRDAEEIYLALSLAGKMKLMTSLIPCFIFLNVIEWQFTI